MTEPARKADVAPDDGEQLSPRGRDRRFLLQSGVAVGEIVGWDADMLSAHLKAKDVFRVEVTEAHLGQIDRLNPLINTIVALQPKTTSWPRPPDVTPSLPGANTWAGCTACRRRSRTRPLPRG